jgi:hypothetical protein
LFFGWQGFLTATSPKKGGANMAKIIFCKYVVRKGKRIYPKKAKVLRFPVK